MSNKLLEITSPANPRIKELSKMKNSKEHFLVEGFHLVEMAFGAGMLEEVFYADFLPEYLNGVKSTKVSKDIIDKLSSAKNPEPILGLAHKENPNASLGKRILVIDRVQDPGNLGTMLRSALAFGFPDVMLLPGTCSPYNDKAIASSQGAIFPLNLYPLNSEEELLELCEKDGISLFATGLENALPLEGYPFHKEDRLAFILGNEGKGVSKNLLENSKAVLRISMEGIDSLNVGVATGILLHSVYVL